MGVDNMSDKKLNEGIFDFIRGVRGGLRGASAGYSSAKGTDDEQIAENLLRNEMNQALENFKTSLRKMGYDRNQIQDIVDAFETNINLMIDAAKHYYPM